MEIIAFQVQGSAEEPYLVTFSRGLSGFTAACSCPAGQSRQSCKHRLGILDGSSKGVVSSNIEQVAVVAAWLPGSRVAEARQLLAAAEAELERAKKGVSSAKSALAAALHVAP
ncbi:hypothetical protein [Pseudoxanthomonas japonensis]|uniref:hypothetical protein n=1 Tax=Pseudoxanthomonas japonensis TaxID=69284 RepID=UPI003747B832